MGGSSGGGGGVETMSSQTEWQRKLSKEIYEALSGKMGVGAEQYSGDIVAPLVPGMAGVMEQIGQYDPGRFDQLSVSAIERALSGMPSYQLDASTTEKYFKKGVMAPLLREFDQSVKPRINEGFARAGGMFSSRRGEATARSMEGLMTEAGAQLTSAQMSNQRLEAQLAEAGMMRQLQGIGLAEAFGQAPLNRANALTQALSPFQQHQQNQATAAYQEWLRTRPEQSPWMNYGMNFTGQSQMAAYGAASGGSGNLGSGIGTLGGMAAGAYLGSPAGLPGIAIGAGIGGIFGGTLGGLFS